MAFADILLVLLVGLSGIALFVFGIMTRKGVISLVGGLMLLFVVVSYEGYSVDTWVSEGAENEAVLHTVEYVIPPEIRAVAGVVIALLLFIVLSKIGIA